MSYSGTLTELEQTLLLNCWDDSKDAAWLSVLRPEDFSDDAARYCFKAIQEAQRRSTDDMSMFVVLDIMRQSGNQYHAEKMAEAFGLTSATEGTSSIRAMVAHVREEGGRRRFRRALEDCLGLADDRELPLAAVQEQATRLVASATARTSSHEAVNEKDGFLSLGDKLAEERLAEPDATNSIRTWPTPWPSFNDVQNPESGEFIVLGGLSGQGKSAKMLQTVSEWGKIAPGCIFSREMLVPAVLRRRTAQELKINPREVTAGHCYEMAEMHARGIWIDTEPCNWMRLCQKVRQFKLAHPDMGWFAVDHLALYTKGSYDDITPASKALSLLTLELGLVGLCLVQLLESKFADTKRKCKKPTINDICGSHQMKDDAAKVWAIHRPRKWDERANPKEAWFLVLKDRSGAGDHEVPMTFEGSFVSFLDGLPPRKPRPSAEYREDYVPTDDDFEEYGLPRSPLGDLAMQEIPL